MRLLALTLIAALSASQIAAQSLSEAWEIVGTFDISFAGTETSLYAVRNIETGEATLARTSDAYGDVIVVTGVAPDGNGEPGVPILTVTFSPFWGDRPKDIEISLREADRLLTSMSDSGSEAHLTDVSLGQEGAIAFGFEGELVVATPDADGTMTPAPGTIAQPISGRFAGTLPEE